MGERVDSGARWVKGGEGKWLIFPGWVSDDGSSIRYGGSVAAFEMAHGPGCCDGAIADANAAKERGEESVPWPA